jgi:hypothetical protein
MNSLSIIQQRNSIAASQGFKPSNLSQSYLRADVLLNTGGSFAFDYTYNKAGKNATEKLLAINDAFVVTAIAVKLKKISSATPSDTLHAKAKSYTYLNTATGIFDGSAGDANLQALYAGSLNVNIDNDVIFPALPMEYFERVPTSQQGQVTALTVTPTSGTISRDGVDGALYGFFAIEPFIIKGDGKNFINLVAPLALDFTEASENNYATCFLAGFLCQNENNVRSGRLE